MLGVPDNIINEKPTTAWIQVNHELNGESLHSFKLVNMKYNPNQNYQGQQVMVINGNFKGYLGRITSTNADDTVLIEISATMQKVQLKLSELSFA